MKLVEVPDAIGHVLLVEAQSFIAMLVMDTLNELRCSVCHVATAEEGLAAASSRRPDCLVCNLGSAGDVQPEDLMKQLRLDVHANVPVIVLTGYQVGNAELQRLGDGGAPIRVVTKPIDVDDLTAAVHAALARGRSTD